MRCSLGELQASLAKLSQRVSRETMMLHLLDVESCDDVVERDDSGDGNRVGMVVGVRRSEVADGRRVDGPLHAPLGMPEGHPLD